MKVEVIGQRSRSPRQKYDFHGFCIVYLANDLEVKGHEGQGQRSHGSRSKVTWVKVKGHCPRPNITLNIDQKGEGYGIKVKGHKGHGQVIPDKGRWAHINVKLLHVKIMLGFMLECLVFLT